MSTNKPNTKNAAQLLEEQKTRFQTLLNRRTAVQVELATAERQLKEAGDEAEEEFGTRDIGQLRELFSSRETDNARKVQEFIGNLDALEAGLKEVEARLAS